MLTQSPAAREILTIEGSAVCVLDGSSAFFFKAGMAVDADGAPTAYHPQVGRGLDALGNAGHPGNWYGVVTDTGLANGKPVVQGASDPAPGFYVSPTALHNKQFGRADPRRYVDSTQIPYISLPGHHAGVLKAKLGDLAMVINSHNGLSSAAICADIGPRAKIGEGSIALAQALHLSGNARHGGASSRSIVYLVFPQSGHGVPLLPQIIQSRAQELFKGWGGMELMTACFPELARWKA